MTRRRRLDVELVRRGMVPTREQARELIGAGEVLVSGSVATKPARLVDAAEPVEIQGPGRRFVGRGGEKLDAALDRFGLDPAGWRVVDAGASTGGFTDCVLQRGARRVVAIDVGHGQLDAMLRADPRVDVRERRNIRDVTVEEVGGPVDLVVADLSFISLRTVLAVLVGLVAPGGHVVALVKPQFEVGRADAGRGRGVVRDPELWERALLGVLEATRAAGATMIDAVASPLTGAKGNVEFLVHVVVGSASTEVTPAKLRTITHAATAVRR